MSNKESLVNISVPSEADYTADQYKFVAVNSSGRAVRTGAGAKADGVLQNKPNLQGRPASVAIQGVSKVVAGAAITAGALVTSDATGRAVTATTGNVISGRAMVGAGGAGEIISVLLHTQNHYPSL